MASMSDEPKFRGCATPYLQEPQHSIEAIDIWRAANEIMKLYGEDAVLRACMRADALLDQGDTKGFFVWKRIARAIDDLAQKPSGAEPVN